MSSDVMASVTSFGETTPQLLCSLMLYLGSDGLTDPYKKTNRSRARIKTASLTPADGFSVWRPKPKCASSILAEGAAVDA